MQQPVQCYECKGVELLIKEVVLWTSLNTEQWGLGLGGYDLAVLPVRGGHHLRVRRAGPHLQVLPRPQVRARQPRQHQAQAQHRQPRRHPRRPRPGHRGQEVSLSNLTWPSINKNNLLWLWLWVNPSICSVYLNNRTSVPKYHQCLAIITPVMSLCRYF